MIRKTVIPQMIFRVAREAGNPLWSAEGESKLRALYVMKGGRLNSQTSIRSCADSISETEGERQFWTDGRVRKAVHYVVHVDIGGVTGNVAKLIGKQPPDTHIWSDPTEN